MFKDKSTQSILILSKRQAAGENSDEDYSVRDAIKNRFGFRDSRVAKANSNTVANQTPSRSGSVGSIGFSEVSLRT